MRDITADSGEIAHDRVGDHSRRVRDDLVRRLSVIRIDVPPLRNRREDIPALANYFLRDICASLRVPPKTLSRPALSARTKSRPEP